MARSPSSARARPRFTSTRCRESSVPVALGPTSPAPRPTRQRCASASSSLLRLPLLDRPAYKARQPIRILRAPCGPSPDVSGQFRHWRQPPAPLGAGLARPCSRLRRARDRHLSGSPSSNVCGGRRAPVNDHVSRRPLGGRFARCLCIAFPPELATGDLPCFYSGALSWLDYDHQQCRCWNGCCRELCARAKPLANTCPRTEADHLWPKAAHEDDMPLHPAWVKNISRRVLWAALEADITKDER